MVQLRASRVKLPIKIKQKNLIIVADPSFQERIMFNRLVNVSSHLRYFDNRN